MSRGMPSMTALLALLAVAGYQNRDRISEMLGGGNRAAGPPGEGGQRGGTPVGGLGGLLGGAGTGNVLGSGLRDLIDRFRQSGEAETAESWVRHGPNREVTDTQLERALGGDTIEEISRATGLSRQDVLARLSRELPSAVDKYTPEGRLPDA